MIVIILVGFFINYFGNCIAKNPSVLLFIGLFIATGLAVRK